MGPPRSRAAASKAQKKRRTREKAREVEGQHSGDKPTDLDEATPAPAPDKKQSASKTSQKDEKPPAPNPKSAAELEALKTAVLQKASASDDKRIETMLHPPNPSLGLRKLPYTPIVPPGVSWSKPTVRSEKLKLRQGETNKQKIQAIKSMLSGSEKLRHLLEEDSEEDNWSEEEEEAEAKDRQMKHVEALEDRTIHAPVALQLRPRQDFPTIQERLELTYGAVVGSQVLFNESDVLHGQIAPKNLAGYTYGPQKSAVGVLIDWDGVKTRTLDNEMVNLKATVLKQLAGKV